MYRPKIHMAVIAAILTLLLAACGTSTLPPEDRAPEDQFLGVWDGLCTNHRTWSFRHDLNVSDETFVQTVTYFDGGTCMEGREYYQRYSIWKYTAEEANITKADHVYVWVDAKVIEANTTIYRANDWDHNPARVGDHVHWVADIGIGCIMIWKKKWYNKRECHGRKE